MILVGCVVVVLRDSTKSKSIAIYYLVSVVYNNGSIMQQKVWFNVQMQLITHRAVIAVMTGTFY